MNTLHNSARTGSADHTGRLDVVSPGPDETGAIGEAIGAQATAGYVVLLVGPLGTGKTCLTQGILRGLGSEEHARSPTFVVMSQYEARLTLYHVDLYRLDSADEIDDLGLDEYLSSDGICVIEWAEKGTGLYPAEHLLIELMHLDETLRRIVVTANGLRYQGALTAVESALADGH